MKKIFFLLILLIPLHVNAAEKKTTFTNEIFSKAQSDGKTVVVSSWIKYCTSCASQMKALNNVEKDYAWSKYADANKRIADRNDLQQTNSCHVLKDKDNQLWGIGQLVAGA